GHVGGFGGGGGGRIGGGHIGGFSAGRGGGGHIGGHSAVLAVASAVVAVALVVTSAVPVDASAEWAFPAAARDRDLERVPWAGRASAPWGTERVRLRAAARASPRRGSTDPATDLSASPVVTSALQGRCAARAWVAGSSAIAPSATWLCDRSSRRPGSTADSSVRAGRGGAAVSSSAGSGRCSGPTLTTTFSITCIGLMPMTIS